MGGGGWAPGLSGGQPHEDASEIDQGGLAKADSSDWFGPFLPRRVDMASDSPARSLDEIDLSALRVSRTCFFPFFLMV